MHKLYFLLVVSLGFLLAACEQNDLEEVPSFEPRPWRTDVQYVDPTNTPDKQIERFVAANNIDTSVTSNGLVYLVDNPGGPIKPTLDSTVTVYYKGYLVNGQVFDESRDGQPGMFKLRTLIKGWREGLPLLGAGGKMWMLVRPELGYGNSPPSRSGITPQSVLVFEIELVEP